MLHLTGTRAVNADCERSGQRSVSLEDIRRFRQLDNKAPGHPEYHWVSGVELFERYCREDPDYREQVLPDAVTARISVEQGATLGWARCVGRGDSIGMETFGASARLKELQKKFGFVPEGIIGAAKVQIARARR